jgi:acyl-CoA reductase-like NAD-dependent aldehyde dehydrogenase
VGSEVTDAQREKDVDTALRAVRATCNAWVHTTLDAEIRRLRRLADPSRALGLHDTRPAAPSDDVEADS